MSSCAPICGLLDKVQRYRHLGGLLLGPLALLASVSLPDLKLRRYLRLLAEH